MLYVWLTATGNRLLACLTITLNKIHICSTEYRSLVNLTVVHMYHRVWSMGAVKKEDTAFQDISRTSESFSGTVYGIRHVPPDLQDSRSPTSWKTPNWEHRTPAGDREIWKGVGETGRDGKREEKKEKKELYLLFWTVLLFYMYFHEFPFPTMVHRPSSMAFPVRLPHPQNNTQKRCSCRKVCI